RHDALEKNCRSRIGDRCERKDDADGFRDLDQTAFRKFANRSNRSLVLDVVVDKLGRDHILQGFVFHHPEACLLYSKSREVLRLLQASDDHRLDDSIDVFLCVLSKDRGGVSGLLEKSVEVCDPLCAEAFCGKRDPNLLGYYFGRDHCRPLVAFWGGIIRGSGSALRNPLLAWGCRVDFQSSCIATMPSLDLMRNRLDVSPASAHRVPYRYSSKQRRPHMRLVRGSAKRCPCQVR